MVEGHECVNAGKHQLGAARQVLQRERPCHQDNTIITTSSSIQQRHTKDPCTILILWEAFHWFWSFPPMALPLPLCPPRMVHYYWKSPFQQTHHDLQLCASFPQYTSSPSPFDSLLFLSYYYTSLPAGDRAEHYLPCGQYLFWAFRKSRLFLIFTLVAFRQILRDP